MKNNKQITNNNNSDKITNNNKEHSTKYGEFVPSYFTWQSLELQKKRAEELNKITKSENQN